MESMSINFRPTTKRLIESAIFLLAFSTLLMAQKIVNPKPPGTRIENVIETIPGVAVSDPFRWLEKGDAPEVRQWTEAQNAWTRAALDPLPGRERMRQRLSELLSIGTVAAPEPRGRRYFYERREALQNQPVLYVRDGLKGQDRPLIDPNALSQEGTIALDWWYVSKDGKRLAYGLSANGSEKSTLHVMEVE